MDPSDLNLRDLRVLDLTLTLRNLTQVADALRSSQPNVSKALARLRRQFGDPLVVRSGGTLRPTTRALGLQDALRDLLATADRVAAPHVDFDPATSNREFCIQLSDIGMIYILPPLMRRLTSAAPQLRISAVLLEADWHHRLETAQADLAVGDFPRAATRLRRQQFYAEGYRTVLRRDHPRLAMLGDIDAFLAEEHILIGRSGAHHAAQENVESAFEALVPPDRIRLRLPNFLAAAATAAQGDQLATMPANLANLAAATFGLTVVETPIAMPTLGVAQFWHERMQGDPGHRWLRATLHSLFRRKGGWPSPGEVP